MATFGNIALAGTVTVGIEDTITGGFFQMGATAGEGDSITIKLTVTRAAHNMKCALYDSLNNLVPNSVTEEIAVPIQAAIPTTFNFGATKPTLTAAAWYYIVVWSINVLGSAATWYEYTGGAGLGYVDEMPYNSFPDPIPWWVYPDYLFDGYCTYTETVAPAAAKKHPSVLIRKIGLPTPMNAGLGL